MSANKTSKSRYTTISKTGILLGLFALGAGVTAGQAQDTATVSRDTSSRTGQTESAQRDTAQNDSTQWGYPAERNPEFRILRVTVVWSDR